MLTQRVADCEALIYQYAGESFNLNSPKQLGELLFEKLGLPAMKKTKSGYSKASKMLLPEEFDAVLTYAQKRRTDLQEAMYRGKAEALPYEMGTQNGCTYCPYRDICGFDEQIEGYEYRKLEKLPKEIVMEKIMAKLEEEKQTWE